MSAQNGAWHNTRVAFSVRFHIESISNNTSAFNYNSDNQARAILATLAWCNTGWSEGQNREKSSFESWFLLCRCNLCLHLNNVSEMGGWNKLSFVRCLDHVISPPAFHLSPLSTIFYYTISKKHIGLLLLRLTKDINSYRLNSMNVRNGRPWWSHLFSVMACSVGNGSDKWLLLFPPQFLQLGAVSYKVIESNM